MDSTLTPTTLLKNSRIKVFKSVRSDAHHLASVRPSVFGRRGMVLIRSSCFGDRLMLIRPFVFDKHRMVLIRPSCFGDHLMLIRPFGFGSTKVIGFPHQLPPEFFCRGILGRRIHHLWSSFGQSERTWLSHFRCEE